MLCYVGRQKQVTQSGPATMLEVHVHMDQDGGALVGYRVQESAKR